MNAGHSENEITPEWFDPEFWAGRAQPVESGGRGSAWFVDAYGQPVVLRKYLRGGLIARLSRSSYIFIQESSVRSFAELRLLEEMQALQLPVPAPVAAWYVKTSALYYQAAIIVERLVGTVTLADLLDTLPLMGWAKLGGVLRRFHDAGVSHADLNCYNILVRNNEFFLIDFDKGKIVRSDADGRWRQASLDRLARSLRKVSGIAAEQRVWETLMTGYNRSSAVEPD